MCSRERDNRSNRIEHLLRLLWTQCSGNELLLANVRDHRHQPNSQIDVGQLHADEDDGPVLLGHMQSDLTRDGRLAGARGSCQEVQAWR